MESEASHRSSVSAPAPPSVHSRVLQQLDISEKSHDRYLSNTYAAIEETRSLCRFINTEGEEKVKNLEEHLKQMHMEKKVQVEKEEEHSALLNILGLLNNKTLELEKSIMGLSDVKKRQEELIDSQLSEIESSLEEKKMKNDLLLDSILWFERNLGFRVKHTKNNGLWIILTKVLPNDLEREFSFSIHHDQQYTLLECTPAMGGTKDLLKELNRTNNLSKFIFDMRNMFRKEFA